MPQPPGRPPQPNPEGTRLESDDEIRQAIQARQAELAGKAARPAAPPAEARGKPARAPARPAAPPPEPEPEVPTEKPQWRPPTALLCLLDDGKLDGEWVRLRADRYVIGRGEADIRIPHDGMMSGQHAQLVRQKVKDGYRWVLTDLGSTNGTWVRIGKTQLQDGTELLLGRGQYRFEAGATGAATTAPAAAAPREGTLAWTGAPVSALVPSLVEMTPSGPGARYPLTLPEYWIGRDAAACAIARPDDPFLNPRHARLVRDGRGQWHAENHRSANGLWLRVEEMPLGPNCQLRMGEQRFLFRVL